ncbi:serine hydrolase domain-containing protein [Dyella lipolytica]|uniref:Serine hydrolase n=1 Tax=Dyella lipolytica TaxID=1867835 RepID=A0ABW8IXA2_9GAMM|nr:serine hydrolase [Dyella lipolytica]
MSISKKSIGAWLLCIVVAVLLALAGLGLWKRPDHAIRVATASVSDVLCSGVFVSGLAPDRVFAENYAADKGLALLLPHLHYSVDRVHRRITTDWHGRFENVATYYPNYGCALAWQTPDASTLQAASGAAGPAETEAVVNPSDPLIRDALARAFEEPATGPLRHTHAIVILHDGNIVAEQYAEGFGPDTPQIGFSVSKSVVNALVGILVRKGELDIHAPAPIAAWKDSGDPRHGITLDQLMRMTSGLSLAEEDNGFDPVSIMLFRMHDMASYAAQAPLKATPGQTWEYSSGNTLLVAGVIRDKVSGGAPGLIRFAHKELFDPIGMRHVLMEFDSAQTLIGSTRIYASARDWARFGQLYLDGGTVNGQRILPAQWDTYSSSPTLDSPYGSGFWTNVAAKGDTQARIEGMPPDAYMASGAQGQRIVIVPAKHLVIVRLGTTVDPPNYDIKGLVRLVADVSTAIK